MAVFGAGRVLVTLLAALQLVVGCTAIGGGDDGRLRMIAPNVPGGGYDLTARTAAKVLGGDGMNGIQVFNVLGGGGTVALARLMNERGNPDLMMMMGLGVVGATLTGGSPLRASGATAIARLIEEPAAILVPAASPYRTIGDLVDAWRTVPGSATIGGGSSLGGPDHLFPMEFARAVGISANAVSYRAYEGGGDLLTALLGGRLPAGASGLGEYADQVRSGQLRVLAVAGVRRVEEVDAPTLKEAGIDLVFTNWRGVLAPPDLSGAARARLVDVVSRIRTSAAWREALRKNAWTDAYLEGDDFSDFLHAEDGRVSALLRDLDLG